MLSDIGAVVINKLGCGGCFLSGAKNQALCNYINTKVSEEDNCRNAKQFSAIDVEKSIDLLSGMMSIDTLHS